jgi:hypothetical protein
MLHIGQEAGWGPEPVRTLLNGQNSFSYMETNPDTSVFQHFPNRSVSLATRASHTENCQINMILVHVGAIKYLLRVKNRT